jgi:copper chaperone CopZ
MNNIDFKLDGLSCEACVKLSTNRFKKVLGVSDVNINLATGEASVSGKGFTLEDLEKSLEGTTYKIVK